MVIAIDAERLKLKKTSCSIARANQNNEMNSSKARPIFDVPSSDV
jgi:hypothetical protein